MAILSTISVLGCGWLGLPLAKELISLGFSVKGSTSSPGKLPLLRSNKIDAYLVQLPLRAGDSSMKDFFKTDILFINIPPQGKPEIFLESIRQVIGMALEYSTKHVIFISSTSVYADTNSSVSENDMPFPSAPSGKAMLEAETLFKSKNSFTTTIIRFAGLVGPGRHPGRFLAGKKDLPNGLAPVNLIHLDDCIGIVKQIISQNAFGNTFNACSPHHPSKKDFYTRAAQATGLETPLFKEEKLSWKIVNSVNTPRLLGYDFKISNWIGWLNT